MINYTGFGCNNMAKFFDYNILAIEFVLKLKQSKDSSVMFHNGHEVIRFFQALGQLPSEYDLWLVDKITSAQTRII